METLTMAIFLLVLINCIMIYSLRQKARHFEKVIAKCESREQTKLERDTMEALTLLRAGKTEEAKGIAERIINP